VIGFIDCVQRKERKVARAWRCIGNLQLRTIASIHWKNWQGKGVSRCIGSREEGLEEKKGVGKTDRAGITGDLRRYLERGK
jgi:hypothetical protein